VNLSISIMASPSRMWHVEKMLERLSPYEPRVLVDRYHEGCWATAKRAWAAFDRAADQHLVLQDDVYTCPNFKAGCEAALSALPDPRPVSFYANRKVIEEARSAGSAWALIDGGTWGQAMSLPTHLIPEFFEWERERVKPEFQHDDSRTAMFCVERELMVHCTVPSLVEHVGHAHSLFGHSAPVKRVARWYIGEADPTEINWTAGLHNPPRDKSSTVLSRYGHFLKERPDHAA